MKTIKISTIEKNIGITLSSLKKYFEIEGINKNTGISKNKVIYMESYLLMLSGIIDSLPYKYYDNCDNLDINDKTLVRYINELESEWSGKMLSLNNIVLNETIEENIWNKYNDITKMFDKDFVLVTFKNGRSIPNNKAFRILVLISVYRDYENRTKTKFSKMLNKIIK